MGVSRHQTTGFDIVHHVFRRDDDLDMVRIDHAAHPARIGKLAEFLLLESDRERLDSRSDHLVHEYRNEARIDSAAQEKTERHFAHEPLFHRVQEEIFDELGASRPGRAVPIVRFDIPVGDLLARRALHEHEVPRLQRNDSLSGYRAASNDAASGIGTRRGRRLREG